MKVIVKGQIINADQTIISYTPVLLNDVKYLVKDNEKENYRISIELYLNVEEINHVGYLYVYMDEKLIISEKIYRYY